MLDPYSIIQTIIRVTAKKHDQLTPRFGTCLCWTAQSRFRLSMFRVAGMGIVHVSAGPCGHSLIFLLIDAARAL